MNRNQEHEVMLALGANIGDPVAQIREALRQISRTVTIEAVSSLYRTEPVGGIPQPDFYNIVCRGTTLADPQTLQAEMTAIEDRLGRHRRVRFGPRVIDIDILAFDDRVFDTPRLTVPHPRMHERAFVLRPLVDVSPRWRHPVLGRTASQLLAELDSPERVDRVGTIGPADARDAESY